MAREGYARMSMEAVAQEAGTTKSAIYRRYPGGKAELATTALADLRERAAPARSGDPRADLVAELRSFQAGIGRPFGMAMIGTVLAEEHHTPELLRQFRKHLVEPRRARLRSLLEQFGVVDPELAASMLVGSYYAQYLASGRVPCDWSERAASLLLWMKAGSSSRRETSRPPQ